MRAHLCPRHVPWGRQNRQRRFAHANDRLEKLRAVCGYGGFDLLGGLFLNLVCLRGSPFPRAESLSAYLSATLPRWGPSRLRAQDSGQYPTAGRSLGVPVAVRRRKAARASPSPASAVVRRPLLDMLALGHRPLIRPRARTRGGGHGARYAERESTPVRGRTLRFTAANQPHPTHSSSRTATHHPPPTTTPPAHSYLSWAAAATAPPCRR